MDESQTYRAQVINSAEITVIIVAENETEARQKAESGDFEIVDQQDCFSVESIEKENE